MDFEIGHLDIIAADTEPQKRGVTKFENLNSQSLVLNELQKDTEELQAKMKLNNRRLLLFETENNKLIEEKNKYFFEMQNLFEKNQLFTEKATENEQQILGFLAEISFLEEKNKTFEKINLTQSSELKRFTKFHLKIQNVIKPYLQQLKTLCSEQKDHLSKTQNLNLQLQSHLADSEQKHQNIQLILSEKISGMEQDKSRTISVYEEQIHSFSKEIIHLEQKNEDLAKEVARLKKACEFKNYFENELIKFKRIHEEDQREILSLKDKINSAEVRLIGSEQTSGASLEKLKNSENQLHHSTQMLEASREQLLRSLDHSQLLTERLARLEKLNLNLSQQMHLTT